MPASIYFVVAIFDELIGEDPRSIDRALAQLLKQFPQKLTSSIVGGLKGRLARLAETARMDGSKR